jgi:hypothetical protein
MEDCSRASHILTSTESKCVIRFISRTHHLGTSPSTQWRTAKPTWKTWRGETFLDFSWIRTTGLWFSSPKLSHYTERNNEREELNDMKVQKLMNSGISNVYTYQLRSIYIIAKVWHKEAERGKRTTQNHELQEHAWRRIRSEMLSGFFSAFCFQTSM